jgi:hypothetical protein
MCGASGAPSLTLGPPPGVQSAEVSPAGVCRRQWLKSRARKTYRRRLVPSGALILALSALAVLAVPATASALDWNTELVSAPTGTEAELPSGSPTNLSGEQMSADGKRVVFETWEQLVPADTNPDLDVYERSDGVTKLISAPAPGAPAAGGANAILAGDQIYFESAASLVPEDTDGGLTDVYASANGAVSLVSAPSAGATGSDEIVGLVGASADGSTAYMTSTGHLTGDDDEGSDLFENSNGTTRLVSVPAAGASAGSQSVQFDGASSDGERVFFETRDSLTSEDADGPCSPSGGRPSCLDIYERRDGETHLVSAPESATPLSANGDVHFDGISEDGTHVFFDSPSLVPGEPAGIYERFGGHTQLVSAPAAGGSGSGDGTVFGASSGDGQKIFFTTRDALAPEDTDGGFEDVYERSNGVTTLLSVPGPGADPEPTFAFFDGASRDGLHVFFESTARYSTDDPNDINDIYERVGGVTNLISAPGADDVLGGANLFIGSSADGSRVFFAKGAIFEHSDGITTLVSTPGPGGAVDPNPQPLHENVSDDGTRVLWQSSQQMTSADADDRPDIYEAALTDQVPAGGGRDPGSGGGVAGDVVASPGIEVHKVILPKTWRKLSKPGVRVLASCTRDCRMEVTVRMSSGTARAAGLPSTTIARGSAQTVAGEQHWLSAKAIPSIRRALRSFSGHGRLQINVTASAPS